MSLLKKISMTAGVVLAAGTLVATEAAATEGYFQNGLGARNKGMAGAGVADGQDATTITLNPAGLVRAGRQFNGSVSVFMPFRSYTAGGPTVFAIPGSQKSKRNIFAIPNIAYSVPISDTTTFGFGISGNGGMNTTYSSPVFVGGSGKTGVDLIQMTITGGIGTRLGKFVSVGIAPVVTLQRFKAKGLQPFDPGFTSAPGRVTNRGYAYNAGLGFRIGAEVQVADNMRVGASYQTRTYSTRFKKYAGLFAQRGEFDIPANFQVGVAYNPSPDLTLNFDVKYIMYSDINAIANKFTFAAPLGFAGGPGFGWRNVATFKIGAEYKATEDLTLRAGYAYNTSPLRSGQLLFNVLAPATSKQHITAGASYQFSENSQLDFAAMYAPNTTKRGFGPLGFQPITLKMDQLDFTVGYTYKWN